MKKFGKFLMVTAVFVGVLVALSAALASWLATGSGSGSATATVHTNSTIASDTTGTALYPGGTATITVTISNPNPYPEVVTSIGSGTSNAIASGYNSGACAAGNVTTASRSNASGLTQSDNTTVTIPANNSGTYSLTASMIANADDGCQNQTFTIPLTANLKSAA